MRSKFLKAAKGTALALLAGLLPFAAAAEQEAVQGEGAERGFGITDADVQRFRDFPIGCAEPDGQRGCMVISEGSFLTKKRGVAMDHLLVPVNADTYLRLSMPYGFTIGDDRSCLEDPQRVIEETVFGMTSSRTLDAEDFAPLSGAQAEQGQKLLRSFLAAMLGKESQCSQYAYLGDTDGRPRYEIKTYLDGEPVFETTEMELYPLSARSTLSLRPLAPE